MKKLTLTSKLGLSGPYFNFSIGTLQLHFIFFGWTEFDKTLHSACVEIYEQNLVQTKDTFSSENIPVLENQSTH